MIPKNEILEAAKEAGLDDGWDSGSEDKDTFNEIQIRFAKIIERKTIERCAFAANKAWFEEPCYVYTITDAIRKLGE